MQAKQGLIEIDLLRVSLPEKYCRRIENIAFFQKDKRA